MFYATSDLIAREFIHNNCYDLGVKGRDNESGFGLFILPLKIPAKEIDSMFTDIENHWDKEYILNIAQKGLMNGYTDGTFKPDEYPTRAELAKVLYLLLND